MSQEQVRIVIIGAGLVQFQFSSRYNALKDCRVGGLSAAIKLKRKYNYDNFVVRLSLIVRYSC